MVVSLIPNLSFALMLSIEAEYTDIILFTHCFRKYIDVGASILNLLNKCLHHRHMNNTVNSFDVSIVQFILYNCRLFTLRTGIQNMHIRTCKSIELNKTPHVDRNLNARGILTFQ